VIEGQFLGNAHGEALLAKPKTGGGVHGVDAEGLIEPP
jgi:hypothetical protein